MQDLVQEAVERTGPRGTGSRAWVAHILTWPLGASTGDVLGHGPADGGLGLGTSLLLLGTILAVVVYLTIPRKGHTELVHASGATDGRRTGPTVSGPDVPGSVPWPVRGRRPGRPE
ncbi:MAG: hypothetical protein H7233_02760 [Pseudorhodobacter sp.]|nr:hypothetical protein [Frankiaceae bacterium]